MNSALQQLLRYVGDMTTGVVHPSMEQTLRGQFKKVADVGYGLIGVSPDANKDALKAYIQNAKLGEFREFDPLDRQCDLVDLGEWLGDQGYALRFMAVAQETGLGEVNLVDRRYPAFCPALEQ